MKDTKTKKIECSNNAIRRKEKKGESKKTQIRNEKNQNAKKHKDEKQKNAQSYKIKALPRRWHEIAVLSAYFCHDDIIYYRD